MVIYNFGSSTVYSMWSRGHFPLSLNDCSYLLNERFTKYPIQVSSKSCCYCCCSCREFPCNRVSNFPSFLYGLRQSNLIQWSASQRLILGGLESNFSRIPHYEIDGVCFKVPNSTKQRRVCNRSGRRKILECCCVHSVESTEFDSEDDAQALLRLLSDVEERDEYCDCCERRRPSYERGNRERKQNYGKREMAIMSSRSLLIEKRLRNSGGSKKLSSSGSQNMDKKRDVCCKCKGGETRNGGSDFIERKSNNRVKKVKNEPRKEHYRVDKGISAHSRGEIYRRGKGGSNNSCYCSFPSSDTSENDTEIIDKHSLISEELTNMDRSEEKLSKRKLKEEIEMRNSGASQQENSLLDNAVKLDLRKKQARKISQVASIEDTKSVAESSQMQSRVSMTTDERASSSQKNFNHGKDYITSTMSLDRGTETQNEIMKNQTVDFSSCSQNYNQFTEVSGISSNNFGKSSWSANSVSEQRNEVANLDQKAGNKHHKIYGYVSEEANLRQESKSQRQDRIVKFQEYDTYGNSSQQRKSNTEVSAKESTSLVKASVQETNERLNQRKNYVTGKTDSRQTSQNVTEILVINNSNSDNATISGIETIINSDDHEPLLSTSHHGRNDLETDKTSSLKIQSGSYSQEVDISKKIIRTSGETFRERIDHEERKMLLQKRPVIQTREELNQTGGVTLQIELGKEASPKGESTSLRSPQTRTNVIDKEEAHRFSEEILIPPSSQLVTRDDFIAELTSGTIAEKASRHMSESGSSFKDKSHKSHYKSYSDSGSGGSSMEPLFISPPEDALSSAARFEQSSAQFVGEFIKQARAEVSTSEIQKEESIYGTNLMYEGESEIQMGSSPYGSVNIEIKDHDSQRSSQDSGMKGPTKGLDDDMWRVTEPADEKSSKIKELKGRSETENDIVKRSGRSLWNIIGDIVRLRWGLHAETPKTSKKSGGKSSSSESNSNETWFSGREPEVTIDNDAETGRVMLPESTSTEQLEIEKSSTQIEVASNKTELENVKYHDISPSYRLRFKVGSTSGGNLSASEEEVSGSREDANRLPVVSLGAGIRLSSSPLPSGSKSEYSIAENISLGKTVAPGSNLMEPLKLALAKQELKGGGLKLRKFQRTEQVSRDRFDDWEEAYVAENEQRKMDEIFMREALVEAKKAADVWEVPVGAVLVRHGKIIARGFNLVEELRDSTAHAEIICIREASNLLKSWRLAETTLYVTLEPCPMCAGAILQARVDTLVWGAPNKLLGADGSWIRLFPGGGEGNGSETIDKAAAPVHPFHPNMKVRRGVLSADCADAMQQFFQRRRRKKEKEEASPPTTPSCLPVAPSSAKLVNKMHHLFHLMFCL